MAVSGERRGAAGGTGRRRMVGVSRSRKPPLLASNRTRRAVSRRKRRRSGSNVNLGGEGIGVGVDVGLLQLSILKAGSRVGWGGRGDGGTGPPAAARANVFLAYKPACTQADVHRRPWEQKPGNRTQVHLLSVLDERSSKFRAGRDLPLSV